jgi:hypothetical protein
MAGMLHLVDVPEDVALAFRDALVEASPPTAHVRGPAQGTRLGDGTAVLEVGRADPDALSAVAVLLSEYRRGKRVLGVRTSAERDTTGEGMIAAAAEALYSAEILAGRQPEDAGPPVPELLVPDALRATLDELRFRILTRRFNREVRDGQVMATTPIEIHAARQIADVLELALTVLAVGWRALVCSKGDLLILRVTEDHDVPASVLDLLQRALHRANLREGIKVGDVSGPVMVLGAGMDLEQLTDEQLRRLGLQRIPPDTSRDAVLQGLAQMSDQAQTAKMERAGD